MRFLALLLLLMGLTACGQHPRTDAPAPTFPAVDRSALSEPQRRVVDELRTQFEAQRPGPFYAEGADEQWCADFVSWILNATGQPLINPNSGHWRIPGVYTMQEYFRSVGRLEPLGHRPAVGDVVLWDEGSPLGLHANVVVGVADAGADGVELTTVGGNEEGGIRVRTTTVGAATPLLGYGRLV